MDYQNKLKKNSNHFFIQHCNCLNKRKKLLTLNVFGVLISMFILVSGSANAYSGINFKVVGNKKAESTNSKKHSINKNESVSISKEADGFFSFHPLGRGKKGEKNDCTSINTEADGFFSLLPSGRGKQGEKIESTPNNNKADGFFSLHTSLRGKQGEKNDSASFNPDKINLKNKIIPLTDPVYKILDYFETGGALRFLPAAKPYRKIFIFELLQQAYTQSNTTEKEKRLIAKYLQDIINDSNSFEIYKQSTENNFVLAGVGAKTSFRTGVGENASGSTTNLIYPFFSGDLGEHITFSAGIAGGAEQLSPDLFYESYTTNGIVNFPYEQYGYSFLPYQFQYETNYIHYREGWSPPMNDYIQIALFSANELNTSWLDGALKVSINNQLRSWGHATKNLLLSATARRFPALEMKVQPTQWFRYSYLVGSLFWMRTEQDGYRKNVYGEDSGRPQKMLSLHMIEFIPFHWLQFSLAGNGIWAKRFEMAYMTPFMLPSLVQDNIGDTDNLSLYFDFATQFPKIGKTWLGFYVDDFSLEDSWQMLKYVTNKYAWQLGWRTNLLSGLIPGTTSTLDYTRVTPFVYTHYPGTDFSTSNNRPIDMKYTHDGFNLGFYLPPNSGELSWSLVNIAIPDLILTLDNRFIMHGTNDLSSDNIFRIYGDIYRHHKRNINDYPLLDFTNDGIYDYSFQSEIKFDLKIRTEKSPHFYRLTGGLGYSNTWWESNNSGITAPAKQQFLTGNIGLIVEM